MENKKMQNLWSNQKNNCIFIFIITTLYYCIWYSFLMPIVRCMVSSDEFLSIAIGVTSFSDMDWSGLVGKVQRYYGNGYTVLFTPVMYLIKSPYWRYFIMHAANAVLHGFTGIICYHIYTRYLRRPNNLEAVLVSLTVSLFYFEGLEGTNIYNELPLYFMIWVILYEILWLFEMHSKRSKKVLGTVSLCLSLFYSLLLHTRAIFTIGAVVVTIFIIYFIYRKIIVSLPIFFLLLVSGYFVSESIGKSIRSNLWTEEITQNTVGGALGSTGVFSKFGLLFSWDGIIAFLSTIVGRIFGMVTTSGGILCMGIVILFLAFYKVRKVHTSEEKSEDTYFRIGIIYLGVVIAASFLLFALNATASVAIALDEQGMTYWAFYLRYHFLYFIPLFPFIYGSIYIHEKRAKIILCATTGCFILIKILSAILLSPLFVNETVRYRMKIVYYAFLPFTLKNPKDIAGSEFLYDNLMIGTLLFAIHLVLWFKKKINWSCFVSILTSIYLFSYVMVTLFIPESNTVYDATDKTNEFMKDITPEETGTDKIYYIGYTHLEAEVLQFGLNTWKLIDGAEGMQEEDNYILVSPNILKTEELKAFGNNFIGYKKVDKYEYIYFGGNELTKLFEEKNSGEVISYITAR